MPALEESDFINTAVLWPASSYDRYGQLVMQDVGREIECRWVEGTISAGGPQSDTQGAIAQVYVGEAIDLGSIMWKGTLADLPPDGDFTNEINQPLEVDDYHELEDIRGDAARRWVDLTSFRSALPELESVTE